MVDHQHLALEHFAQVPHIDFGKIHPGTTATAILTLHNPTNQVQHVDIDPVLEPTLTLSPMQLELSPESKQDVCLTWTPVEGSPTGKNHRVAITIRMEGRKRFKAVMTGVSVIKSGRSNRKKPNRSESTFEFTEIDENIIRNGPTSIAWKAEFKKSSFAAKIPAEGSSKKRSENTMPIISPSKIAPYFAKIKADSQNGIEIDIDEKVIEKNQDIDVIIDDVKTKKGGVAFDADFTIKLPKAKPNKSKLLRAEANPLKSVDIKPIVRKGSLVSLADHAAKRKALIDISRCVLTPAKKKLKAPAYSYREGQFYDENWASKREFAFKIWLNLLFKEKETPQAFIIDRNVSSFQSIEELRAHTQILQKAFSCYHSKPVQSIVCAIEQAICSGQMRIRDDINMLNDVGLRDRFVDLMHSFNSAWLKLGLETVFGEMLPASACLRNFIQSRLLSNDELDNEHTYLKTPQGQAFFDDKHKSAMQCFVLKKVMQLVIFLDIAKSQSLFPLSPCLFSVGESIKSTRSLLIEFASSFMAAQGDVVKLISQISDYECAAVQTPLDEFNYQITDLVGDLKDGVRLCALSEEPGLERQILLPAINKSRKKHNVSLALQAFARLGVPIAQSSADEIIDGNHKRVLMLLWNIVSHLTIPSLIDNATVFNEIRLIRRQTKFLNKDHLTCNLYADNIRLQVDGRCIALQTTLSLTLFQLLLRWCQEICLTYEIVIINFTSSFSDGRGFAAIINYYYPQLIKESDIRKTTRTLQDQLKKKKGDICGMDEMSGAAWIQFLHLQASHDEVNEALEGERHNWRLIAHAVRKLGAVPFVFSDPGRNIKQSIVLDENTVILFMSYLCSRLLTLSKESHAARTVQKQWREIQYRKRVLLIPTTVQKLSDPLLSCYHYLRSQRFLSRIRAAQCVIAAYLHQKEIKKQWHASWTIQRCWRETLSRRRLALIRASVDVIYGPLLMCVYHRAAASYFSRVSVLQGTFRTFLMKQKIQRIQSAAVVIAVNFKRYQQCRAACKLQRQWLKYRQQKLRRQIRSAIDVLSGPLLSVYQFRKCVDFLSRLQMIQGTCLAYQESEKMLRLRRSTNIIAPQLRWYLQWHAASALQRLWREMKRRQRSRMTRESVAALSGPIESCFLYYKTQRYLLAISSIQNAARAFLERQSFEQTKFAASVLELHLHRYKRFCAAVTIQKYWRSVTRRKWFVSIRASVTILSASLSSYYHDAASSKYLVMVYGAQCATHTYVQKQRHLQLRLASKVISTHLRLYQEWKAACFLQRRWRLFWQRKRELAVSAANTVLSSALLSYHTHTVVSRRLFKISVLQGAVAAFCKHDDFLRLQHATDIVGTHLRVCIEWRSAVNLQKHWRGFRARRRMRLVRSAVSTLADPLLSLSHYYQASKYVAMVNTLQAAIETFSLHQRFHQCQYAARVIINHFHHYQAWKAACCLQRHWRESKHRKRQRLVLLTTAVLYGPMLSCYSHSVYKKRMFNVHVLQTAAKTCLSQTNMQSLQHAAGLLGTQIRLYIDHRAAVCLQKHWRSFTVRRRMRLTREAFVTLYNPLLSLSYYRNFNNYMRSVNTIQTAAKTYMHSERAEQVRYASAVIILHFGRYMAWKAACTLQKHWRENRRRRRLRLLQAASSTLSGALLSVHHYAICETRLLRIRTLQSALMTSLQLQDIQRHREAQLRNAITCIQSAVSVATSFKMSSRLLQSRQFHSCIKIQRSVRHFLNYRRYSREQLRIRSIHTASAALHYIIAVRSACRFRYLVLRIQSLWRGRRQRLKASTKVRRARERIVDASSRWAPELTIGYRLKQALDVLLSGSKLSELTQACRMLDHVTRTLPGCSVDAVEHNAVPVLYALMRGLNRSKPHIELLGYAVSILATLSQNQMVSQHVFDDESCLDVMLEFLQTQRENPDLFIKVATLLTSGCQNLAFATELRASAKRISSIHALLSRKLDMNVRYQQPGSAAHSKQTALLTRSVKALEVLQQRIR